MYDPAKVDLTTVALKSLILGITLTVSLLMIIFTSFQLQMPVYVFSISIFHLSEFFCTSIFNLSEIDDDSFILNDTELLAVYGASTLEYSISHFLFPFPWTTTLTVRMYVGFLIILLGQSFRSLAMGTAKESFNHYIQREHKSKHKLVTHGIYSISRHPSYFGFYWLIVGHQLWLGNWLMLVVCAYKLGNFFRKRIEFEENYLISFFGEEYINYRRRVGVWIPTI
ncbi:protein-S-isoprenylcysteine O-methyltransferase [[Candida] railenensis]|uniref:Protein-S-isoprenylcysteine O-methyltransferase n=1 Tax=[Candida] railenensis TaxID=45579 RepID=A0A9P0QP59_9ASCO|nr:protein-S-isoprenylcysteine O-methyltransferase [[Candida] railenensis]